MFRLSRRLGPLGGCRCFGALQIRGQGRAAHVFFLRSFGGDRRQVRRIFNAPWRSFKQRALVDRQRPMKNIALDRPAVLQLDAKGTDGALDAAADRDVLRNDAALDLCAIADEKIGGAQLAFDAAVDLRRTAAIDVAHDRHSGADARAWPRVRRRVPPRRWLFDDRVLLLQRPLHGFGRICRGILILLGCFALEHVHLRFPPAFTTERPKLSSRDRARADADLLLPRREDPQVRTPCENRTAQSRKPPRWSLRLRAIPPTEPCQEFRFPTICASAPVHLFTPAL